MRKYCWSVRIAPKRPVTAFCTPDAFAGTLVGAVKKGTTESLQPMAARAAAAAAMMGPAVRGCRPMPPPAPVLETVRISEAQVEGEEVAGRRRVRRDLDAAPDILAGRECHLRVHAGVPAAVPVEQVATREREAEARDPPTGEAVDPRPGQLIADRELADLDEARRLDVRRGTGEELLEAPSLERRVGQQPRPEVELLVREIADRHATIPVDEPRDTHARERQRIAEAHDVGRLPVADLEVVAVAQAHVRVHDLRDRAADLGPVLAEPAPDPAGDERRSARRQRVDDAVVAVEGGRRDPGEPVPQLDRGRAERQLDPLVGELAPVEPLLRVTHRRRDAGLEQEAGDALLIDGRAELGARAEHGGI